MKKVPCPQEQQVLVTRVLLLFILILLLYYISVFILFCVSLVGQLSKIVLHNAIFLAACLATSDKEMYCKLHETCYMFQSRLQLTIVSENTLQSLAATCNGFINSLESLQKVESSSTAGVTPCNFL